MYFVDALKQYFGKAVRPTLTILVFFAVCLLTIAHAATASAQSTTDGGTATLPGTALLPPGGTTTLPPAPGTGNIYIMKEAPSGSVGTFEFSMTGWANFELNNMDVFLFRDLAPSDGPFVITELPEAGWTVDYISCWNAVTGTSMLYSAVHIGAGTVGFEAGDTSVKITLAAGESVICRFENAKDDVSNGSIRIKKHTDPDGDPTLFDFTGLINDDLSDGQSNTVSVAPGTYSVTESAKAGWSLTSIECDDNNSVGDLSTGTVTVNVEPGEDVLCIFLNTKEVVPTVPTVPTLPPATVATVPTVPTVPTDPPATVATVPTVPTDPPATVATVPTDPPATPMPSITVTDPPATVQTVATVPTVPATAEPPATVGTVPATVAATVPATVGTVPAMVQRQRPSAVSTQATMLQTATT